MFRPRLINIIFYFFIKYIVFYIFMMFRNNDFTLIEVTNLKTGSDWFFYLWMFLFLPILSSFLFAVPIYYILKTKRITYFLLVIGFIIIAEYFLYTYFASQLDLMNGVYNEIISLILLLVFFFKPIILIFKKRD